MFYNEANYYFGRILACIRKILNKVFILFYTLQNEIEVRPCEENPDLRIVSFATTPIMSTYLVAFVVGEFDCIEGQTEDGVAVRVYTPLGKQDQGTFALEVNYCFFHHEMPQFEFNSNLVNT